MSTEYSVLAFDITSGVADIILCNSTQCVNFAILASQVSLHKKRSFPLRIYSVNAGKFAGNSGFGHIYWRYP